MEWDELGMLEYPGTWALQRQKVVKTAGSQRATRKQQKSAAPPGLTGSPWWPLFRSVLTLPQCYVLASFGPRFGPWIIMFWASFAALLDQHASTSFSLDSTHTFLLKTWLESYKSAINT